MKTVTHFFSIKQISVAILLFCFSNNSNAMLRRLMGNPLIKRPMIRACQAPAGDEKSKDDEQIQTLNDALNQERVRLEAMCRFAIPAIMVRTQNVINRLQHENNSLKAANAALKEELLENVDAFDAEVHAQNVIDHLKHQNNNLITANAALQKENADLKKSSPQRNENEILK
jgi:hypothetical protein